METAPKPEKPRAGDIGQKVIETDQRLFEQKVERLRGLPTEDLLREALIHYLARDVYAPAK